MQRIELIGTSYVGKSTLFQRVQQMLSPSDSFVTEKQMISIARREIGYPTLVWRKIKQKIIYALGGRYDVHLKTNLLRYNDKIIEKYKYTLSLCYQKEGIELTSPYFAYKTYNRLLDRIVNYTYYGSLSVDKQLLSEESIIHWHLVLHELILNDKFVLPNGIKEDIGLWPKAIICCYADEKTILNRMQLRAEEERINKNHLNKDKEKVIKDIIRKQAFFKKYAQLIEEKGGQVLYIDTALDLESNALKMKDFINNLH